MISLFPMPSKNIAWKNGPSTETFAALIRHTIQLISLASLKIHLDSKHRRRNRGGGALAARPPPRFCNKQRSGLLFLENAPFSKEVAFYF